uniref:Uncharacterized protein n=1 Tax=Chromera velia CCMP2878 TaxID=1169474 RepID=A0A0G4FWW4_9ALVE|eukprot:Cvel_19193.t1-p1 / transcript=Cvel_19193.t1 / gene=Cvel_19193 / organism=Chromera_velia_CCMP2878 / gene_product=hypothetical protein / transcript_product=hypothetical protein / location=Cvel_scaffold1637:32839-33192(+) / protein_length=118 / sequence_SO=supercontig / SO=protein_coding / is_pseudo=false
MEAQEMLPEILFHVREFRAVCDSELCRAVLSWKETGETAEESDLLLLLRLGGNVNCRVIHQDFPEGESPPILYFAILNGLDGAARMLMRFGARLRPYPELQASHLTGTALLHAERGAC